MYPLLLVAMNYTLAWIIMEWADWGIFIYINDLAIGSTIVIDHMLNIYYPFDQLLRVLNVLFWKKISGETNG